MAYLKKYLHIEEVVKALNKYDSIITDAEDVKHLIYEGELEVKVRLDGVKLIPAQDNFRFGTASKREIQKMARTGYLEEKSRFLKIKAKEPERFKSITISYLKEYMEFRRFYRKNKNILIPQVITPNGETKILDLFTISNALLSLFGRGFPDDYSFQQNEVWKSISEYHTGINVVNVDYPILVRPRDISHVLAGHNHDLEFLKESNLIPAKGVTFTGGGYHYCHYLGINWAIVKDTSIRFCSLEGDRNAIPNAVLRNELYIPSQSLMRFEQNKLGIDHGLGLTSNVERALEKHGASKIITLEEAQKEQKPQREETPETANYLDDLNPNYAPDLGLAIEAWQAVNSGYGRKGDTFKNRVIYWLEENHDIGRKDKTKGIETNNLDAKANRIATITNPNRRN